jgi:hypothetical protein
MKTEATTTITKEQKAKDLQKKRQAEAKTLAEKLFVSQLQALTECLYMNTVRPEDYAAAAERISERSIEHAAMFQAAWKRKKGLFVKEE